TKQVTGTQQIGYRNITRGRTNELRWHMYLNAFRNLRSTHLRESDAAARERYKTKIEFGEVRFLRLTSVDHGREHDLLPGLRWVQPDDGNPDDRTVCVVPLPGTLEPGETIHLETEFVAKLPKAYRRTGWGPGNFFMVAQWFPKLGVLEDAGSGKAWWNCHQFHAWTEFFADYGTYDVTIETPKGWPVGATGKLVGAVASSGEYDVRRFVQQDVHDFAWVTDPDYVEHRFTFVGANQISPRMRAIFGKALGHGPQQLELTDVHVRVLLHPEHDSAEQRHRHQRAVETAIQFYGERFGRYPYETLTVVDPAIDDNGDRLGGGMEYPTLITCGTRLYPHRRQLRPEGVTVHEFGHQYWYGLSGNNEFQESWLDEGVCSYTEGRAQDLAYHELRATEEGAPAVGDPVFVTSFGPVSVIGRVPATLAGSGSGGWAAATRLERIDVPCMLRGVSTLFGASPTWVDRVDKDAEFRGVLLPDLPFLDYLRDLPFLTYERDLPQRNLYSDRAIYLGAPSKDPVVQPAWTYLDRQSYRVNSYQRPSTILSTLERVMGPDQWWPCLRRFHERARFAHPTTEDFLREVRAFGGAAAELLARDLLLTTKTLDYGVESVERVADPKAFGRFDDTESNDERGDAVVVKVRRFGDIVAPVVVRFVFEKESVDEVWPSEGQGAWRGFRFGPSVLAGRGELLQVLVDPPDATREVGYGPAGVYVVDTNLLNNAWQKIPNPSASRRRGLRVWVYVNTVLSFFGAIG
ncbi:MAG: M1 family metallopeptidase, partial [Planctomycetota bacterium]|nr:M1 family metallopeptidase [Planctomycetota bacterium]